MFGWATNETYEWGTGKTEIVFMNSNNEYDFLYSVVNRCEVMGFLLIIINLGIKEVTKIDSLDFLTYILAFVCLSLSLIPHLFSHEFFNYSLKYSLRIYFTLLGLDSFCYKKIQKVLTARINS